MEPITLGFTRLGQIKRIIIASGKIDNIAYQVEISEQQGLPVPSKFDPKMGNCHKHCGENSLMGRLRVQVHFLG